MTSEMLLTPKISEISYVVVNRVAAAQAYAVTRPMQGADCANAQIQPGQLFVIANFDGDAARLLKTATENSRLSARANHKIQRVARSVADLCAEVTISRTRQLLRRWLTGQCCYQREVGVAVQWH